MKTFAQLVAERTAMVKAGTLHPGSLVDLARNRIMRLKEWSSPQHLMEEAEKVLRDALALTAEFNNR